MKKPKLQLQIANRIHELRTQRDWTQQQLAEKTDTCQNIISEWEGGIRWIKPDNIEKLAKAFGLTVQEFIFGKPETNEDLVIS